MENTGKPGAAICERALAAVKVCNKGAVIAFTRGVLKLPLDYWTAVAWVLANSDWRAADYPVAYVRRASISEAARERAYHRRGSYALGRQGDHAPTYITELIPGSERSSPCLILKSCGMPLETPSVEAPRSSRKIQIGKIDPVNPILRDDSEAASDRIANHPFDRLGLKRWEADMRESATLPPVDWEDVADGVGLDEDEKAMLMACLEFGDGREIKAYLQWDSKRVDRVRKRLIRQYPIIGPEIRRQRNTNYEFGETVGKLFRAMLRKASEPGKLATQVISMEENRNARNDKRRNPAG